MLEQPTIPSLRRSIQDDNLWLPVADPTDTSEDESVERMTLDVRARDAELVGKFAAYRNALAAVQGKQLRKKWSRKQMAENMFALQCEALRHQLAQMVAELGELPDSDDSDAMEQYAKRVLAWNQKNK